MRGTQAKRLRRLARRATEGRPERRLVQSPSCKTTAINDPFTARGYYRLVKKKFKAL